MAMMTERNNRSIHTQQKATAARLKRHAELMAEFERGGMSREAASQKAFYIVIGKEPK